jgi:Smg protein
MKEERLLNILMYLFKIYARQSEAMVYKNSETISQEMIQAGFHQSEIDEVMHWFHELTDISASILCDEKKVPKSFHVYTREEHIKINTEARNYLLYLERVKIIDMRTRELIIDRAMALDMEVITVSEIKWITFMILYKNPYYQQQQLQLLTMLILNDEERIKH